MSCVAGSDEEDEQAICSFLFAKPKKKTDTSAEVVLKQGYLVKQGHVVKNWKRRHFVLTSEELRYYDREPTGKPKGTIPLRDIIKVRQKARGSFKIYTETREYTLVAANERSKRDWMKAILRAQFRPSHLAQLLSRASSLEKRGRISSIQKDKIKNSLVSGNLSSIAQAEAQLKTFSEEPPRAEGVDHALELVLEQFELMTTEAGLLNVLARLEAVLKAQPVAESIPVRIRAIAAVHHAAKDGRWTPAVQKNFTSTMGSLRVRPTMASATSLDVGQAPPAPAPSASSATTNHTGSTVGTGAGSGESPAAEAPRVRGASLSSQPSVGAGFDEADEEAAFAKAAMSRFDDHYVLGAKIGEGGYSLVYEGAHRGTRDLVAVKCVEKSKLSAQEAKGLIEEVKVMRKLNHPNIVRLIAFYNEPKMFYIVTELMTGGELFDQIVEKTHYSEQQAQQIVRTLARAIAYCHSRNIVHRDLKPENILLSSTEETTQVIKIADMGFARPIRPTGMETSCGTPSYVAPEILRGDKYGSSVDIWSIGVITFILLCGYAPFAGSSQTKLFRSICKGTYRFASPYWDNISAAAKDLISNMLVTDVSKRYTAEQVLQHPWVAHRANASNFMLSGVLKQLRKYNTKRRQVIKRGFLVKRGHFRRNWKRRSFVLTGTELLYYESETSTQPLGVIALADISKVKDMEGEDSFKIFTKAGKKYVVQAASEQEKVEWMRSLMSTQQHSDLMNKAQVALRAQEMQEAKNLLELAEEFAAMRAHSTDGAAPSSYPGPRAPIHSMVPRAASVGVSRKPAGAPRPPPTS